MSDAILYRGNTPVVSFPHCDGRSVYRMPPASRVAAEYATGDFTLGIPVNPELMVSQAHELADANLTVGDNIQLITVPEEHYVDVMYVAIDEADVNMAGASVSVSAMLYENATESWNQVQELQDTATDQAGTLAFDATSAHFISFLSLDGPVVKPYFVPKGFTLVLGLRVDALPSDTTYGFGDMLAKARFVAKVHGLDIPTQI